MRRGAIACAASLLFALGWPLAISAAPSSLTIFDLKLGSAVAALPAPDNFKDFACGSDGGPPGVPLSGWADYGQCAPEADGLHEVYFEYDDEAEYVARAHDDYAAGWNAGTAIDGFPIVASALFDDSGQLMGLRVVTDPRPDQRNDPFLHFRPRQEHYLLALYLKPRFGIVDADCKTTPPAAGEGPVLGMLVKEYCTRLADNIRYTLDSRLLRRPGETDVDPSTGMRTEGAFLSETRAELRFIAPR